MSRLNQSNNGRTLPSLRSGLPDVTGAVVSPCPALRNRVPPTLMPRPTLGQSDQRQPAPSNKAVFAKSLDGVLAARRDKPASRRPERRNHVPIQLDQKNQSFCDRLASIVPHVAEPNRAE